MGDEIYGRPKYYVWTVCYLCGRGCKIYDVMFLSLVFDIYPFVTRKKVREVFKDIQAFFDLCKPQLWRGSFFLLGKVLFGDKIIFDIQAFDTYSQNSCSDKFLYLFYTDHSITLGFTFFLADFSFIKRICDLWLS